MAKGPALVIIARHGARLDAADKTWHLTSPTPYDPPLTYGGWTQAKSLGLRIASILHAREQTAPIAPPTNGNKAAGNYFGLPRSADTRSTNGHGPEARQHKRKQKIIIHTSPFLRCVQTSTAIAAGICQFQPSSDQEAELEDRNNENVLSSPEDLETRSVPSDRTIHSSEYTNGNSLHSPARRSSRGARPEKILLRIDAFLGEWLSPDYFEEITPPPDSTLMVASAKAELLRRGEYIEVQNVKTSTGHFPGGWANRNIPSTSASRIGNNSEDGPLSTLSSLAQVSPFRERASSQGSNNTRPFQKGTSSLSTARRVPGHIYDPPVPSYAVSPSDPIPRGYFAHARDACIDVDYQWDSMRPPQEWGDGGEYGDEWSTMHKRFRKGLARMIGWYKYHGCQVRRSPGAIGSEESTEDEDVILILVTHGAGCNALLGAFTNQPMLVDIGVASLSMAVRKETPNHFDRKSSSPTAMWKSTPGDTCVPDEYELKIVANVDHLRHGVDPAKPLPSVPIGLATPSFESRRRFGASPGSHSPFDAPLFSEAFRGTNSSLGSIRRTLTAGSTSRLPPSYSMNQSPTLSTAGLWSPAVDTPSDTPTSPVVLDFGITMPGPSSSMTATTKQTDEDKPKPLPTGLHRSGSQHGLWGPPPAATHNERERGPKRRWTVTERE